MPIFPSLFCFSMMPTFPEHRNQMYDSSDRPQESRPAPPPDLSFVNHFIRLQKETKKWCQTTLNKASQLKNEKDHFVFVLCEKIYLNWLNSSILKLMFF